MRYHEYYYTCQTVQFLLLSWELLLCETFAMSELFSGLGACCKEGGSTSIH